MNDVINDDFLLTEEDMTKISERNKKITDMIERQSNKKKTKKLCKRLDSEEECKSRADCIFTKTRKCQKKSEPKPRKNNIAQQETDKQIEEEQQTEAKLEEKKSIEQYKLPQQLVEDLRSDPNEEIEQQEVINDPCDEHKTLLEERMGLQKRINFKNKECEDLKFSSIQKYFDKKKTEITCEDLLIGLQKLYIEGKTNDGDFLLYFHDFINMFPRDTMGTLKFKRQHVFEAICKLLLLFNYDKFELGKKKRFYSSLEDFTNNKVKVLRDLDILNTKINESSKGGVADIFFESEFEPSKNNCKDDWMCDCEIPNKIDKGEEHKDILKRQFVLIQNKYYSEEKTINKNYDVEKIYTASKDLNKIDENIEKKIVLMVNNAEVLSQKISRSKHSNKDLIYKIYGVKQLEDWFKELLNDLLRSENIETFKINKGKVSNIKESLNPKFHQHLFTQSTLRYNIEEYYKLFIWGAVPRSGKSYMIANFISNNKIRRESEQNNDIVLILGAKAETECQFIKMFCDYSDFDDYGIISATSGIIKTCKVKHREINKYEKNHGNPFEKYIYLFSQEWFKKGKLESPLNDKKSKKKLLDTNTAFKHNVLESKLFQQLIKKSKIDLFFDEIHKGGSTNTSENILHAFYNAGIQIDIFVMVTATYAKPDLRYDHFQNIDTENKGIKLLEWNYEDQQNMKQVTNDTNKDIIINSRSGIEKEVIKSIFDMYRDKYSPETYLKIISDEYAKHPQLVLIQPEQINPTEYVDIGFDEEENQIDIRNVFYENLDCEACRKQQSLNNLRDPSVIFNDANIVTKLINFIAKTTIQNGLRSLDIGCVYSYLKEMGAPIGIPHSELWFLPDKDLYFNDKECRSSKICGEPIKKDENYDEDDIDKNELPNIEPLTRGLSFLLMGNSFLRENYNVLIVHNTNNKYTDKNGLEIDLDQIFKDTNIYHAVGEKNLSDIIKRTEYNTFKENKSLIILTGAKLRLGISLPCVDIAFNFDNIKSIDNNYQTMFRVLTERQYRPKEYGYYVDFNKDRAIKFLYEYNNTYGLGKKISNFKTKTEYLRSLLILFNYNGLGLIKQDTDAHLKLYQELISNLEMDETPYQNFNLKRETMQNLIKKSLMNIDSSLLKKFKELLHSNFMQSKQGKKITKEITKGNEMRSKRVNNNQDDEQPNDDGSNGEDETKQEEVDDYTVLINNIVEILPSIVAILAMFSNENDFNCDTLENCIESCMLNLDELEELCSCEEDNITNSNPFACYMNFQTTIPYTKEKLKHILLVIKDDILNLKHGEATEQLNTNLNIIFHNIKESMGKNNDALIFTMNPVDIQKKIEQYLPVREEEKNKHGEVFTPIELIEEMFDKLPSSVWANPDLKWLDPANGIGNFPMVAYQRLMKGLEKWEPSKTKRSNHIIENMLYMVEINPKNVKISKKIFGSKANICCADFLEDSEKCFRQFGVDNFDIIMGNPPFNVEVGEKRFGSGRTLWDKFVIKSLESLVKNGYLCYIHPQNWRGLGILHNIWNILNQKQIIYLHIYDEKSGKKLFNVSQSFDLYVLHNKVNNSFKSIVIDENDKKHVLDLSNLPFLPNSNINEILNLLTSEEKGLDVNYGTQYHTTKHYVRKEKSKEYKYPVANNINSDGIEFLYTNDKTKNFFGMPKVIVSVGRYPYPYNDFEGKYGISQGGFGILITSKKHGDDIVKAINSNKFQEILKSTKWGAFQIDYRMFKYFKPDFYKYFLKDKQATKIQALTRGHLQRKKNKETKKVKKGITKLQALTRGVLQRKKTKRSIKKGGGKKTRKHKFLFKLW